MFELDRSERPLMHGRQNLHIPQQIVTEALFRTSSNRSSSMRRTSRLSVNLSITYQGRRAPRRTSAVGRTSPSRIAVEFSFRTPAWRMIRSEHGSRDRAGLHQIAQQIAWAHRRQLVVIAN